jgi:DNA-binding transcriptional regulator YiaG
VQNSAEYVLEKEKFSMSNVGKILNSEILRLSQKVVRLHIGPIRSATSAYRKQLVNLKKQVQQLEREVAALRRASATHDSSPQDDSAAIPRFSAKGLRSLRGRLELSAAEFGRLIEVGAQTVYNWENEKTSPRPAQRSAIAGLRNIGKKQVRLRLGATQVEQDR